MLRIPGIADFQLYRSGQILHRCPVYLHQYLRGIAARRHQRLQGLLVQGHGRACGDGLQGRIYAQDTRQPENDIVRAAAGVGNHVHILDHREPGEDEPTVVISRHRGGRIDFGYGEEPVSAHRPCTVGVRQVVLHAESQLVVGLSKGIVHCICHSHTRVMRVVIRPHLSGKTLQFGECPALEDGIEIVPFRSCYV